MQHRLFSLVLLIVLSGSWTVHAADVTGQWTLSWPAGNSVWSFTQTDGDFSGQYRQGNSTWTWQGTNSPTPLRNSTTSILRGNFVGVTTIPPSTDAGMAIAVTDGDSMFGIAASAVVFGRFQLFTGTRNATTTTAPKQR